MRIVIDMQGAQAESRSRGIGRYTLSLIQAIVRNRGEHEIILALSGLFPDTIEPLRASFDSLLPQENIRVWHAPSPVREREPGNAWRRDVAETIREAFIAGLRPDVVHLTSLFEGYVDDAVGSIGRFDRRTPVSVTLYDLIPLLNPDQYLKPDPVYHAYYLRKIGHLRRASVLLAISESSRQEGIVHLDIAADAVTNISTAADAHFRPIIVGDEQKQVLQQKYGIIRPFVMYTGGIDYRKNIEGLIRAYSLLSDTVRAQHQLVVVCSIHPQDRLRLEALGKKHDLAPIELVLTGFVPEDDLLSLYNLCRMFVFPSWHEGFGLPALEAMACGRAVIASNTSSLPEVIGREDALFDSRNDASIAEKIEQVLTDDAFRVALERHGVEQAKQFSWDISARRAIAALEKRHSQRAARSAAMVDMPVTAPLPQVAHKPRLAYVSPLPPERSGISDYSADLLPELARHYDIDVIVEQDGISSAWVKTNCPIRTAAWFLDNAARYSRVVYHFGNSTFHQHMFALLEKVPGIVVLHDFFLSGIVAHMDVSGDAPGSWAQALYHSHGYNALMHRFHADDTAEVVWAYPCNLSVLENAKGIIVHSEPSRRLFQQWYGEHAANDCAVIPLLRVPPATADRTTARRALKLDDKDFIVCSFGMLGPNKLNHRLLDALLASALAKNPQCVLVFVGENPEGKYGRNLLETIRKSRLSARIRIIDWADADIFNHFLAAADVGVQLRALSRGETSAAVLDCMNFGLPTIINAHGGMADLPDEGTWKLPDNFLDAELIDALETLWSNETRRNALGNHAQHLIRTRHAPAACADLYAESIEKFYQASATDIASLTAALADLLPYPEQDKPLIEVANAIAHSIPAKFAPRQILVDISELVQRDSQSGIQRVVRSILLEWLRNPPQGYRIEPVYATEGGGYRYARHYTLHFLDCPVSALSDDVIEFHAGDRFIGLDLQPQVVRAQAAYYQAMRRQGVHVQFVVYDLLPILMPQAFFDSAAPSHHAWLKVVADSDGLICISKSVADELADWEKTNDIQHQRAFDIRWFHLGANVSASRPSNGIPHSAAAVLKTIKENNAFLMIGTIEPRKGHAYVLAAFEQLWKRGVNAVLVIVGKSGWLVESFIEKIRHHQELDKRLIWLEGVSDEYLEKIYAAGACLIAASEGEGFGLPLIEAAQHKLPIIARDIPVFREVAAEHAFYFSDSNPQPLADAIADWLHHYESGTYPTSDRMSWLTWKQSAEQLLRLVLPS